VRQQLKDAREEAEAGKKKVAEIQKKYDESKKHYMDLK